jgi:hypothetical protein
MLQIQIHVVMPKPGPGITYSSELLDALAQRWLLNEPLPKRVKVSAILWRWNQNGTWKEERNPARMRRVRDDFHSVSYAGPFDFTTQGVSTVG